MLTSLIISDLHLTNVEEDKIDFFANFCKTYASKADQLFILGDLFNTWIGDDVSLVSYKEIINTLRDLSQDTKVFVMAGNRDFLLSEQFELTLILKGVGYRAVVQGKEIVLSLGYSHPVKIDIPETVSVEVVKNTTINLKSCDKELLGLFASNIRSWRRPEPYKGKGILYKNEQILRKAGKAGK